VALPAFILYRRAVFLSRLAKIKMAIKNETNATLVGASLFSQSIKKAIKNIPTDNIEM